MSILIEHPGIVRGIKDKVIEVQIKRDAACASCDAKSTCVIHSKQDMIIEVSMPENSSFKTGDHVLVLEKRSQGFKAVLFSYVIPVFIIFFTLVILFLMNKSDIFAGAMALATLIPYYLIFFLFKNKIKETFVFKIENRN